MTGEVLASLALAFGAPPPVGPPSPPVGPPVAARGSPSPDERARVVADIDRLRREVQALMESNHRP